MILADEINRTPPKTQAALLEAMQEHQVTAAGQRHALEEPFFVLATQNPIEMEGTYPLPEAQLDRFMFNVVMDYLPGGRRGARSSAAPPRAPRTPIAAAVHGRGCAALPRRGPQGADRRGDGALRRAAGRRLATASARHAGLRQPVGQLGRRHAGRPVPGARRPRRGRSSRAGRMSPSRTSGALAAPVLRHRILLNYRAEAEGTRAWTRSFAGWSRRSRTRCDETRVPQPSSPHSVAGGSDRRDALDCSGPDVRGFPAAGAMRTGPVASRTPVWGVFHSAVESAWGP